MRVTSFNEIDKPRPVPPYFLVIELSDWVKALKNQLLFVEGDSAAGVDYAEAQDGMILCLRLNRDLHDDFAGARELDGVSHQIRAGSDSSRVGSPIRASGAAACTWQLSSRPF